MAKYTSKTTMRHLIWKIYAKGVIYVIIAHIAPSQYVGRIQRMVRVINLPSDTDSLKS